VYTCVYGFGPYKFGQLFVQEAKSKGLHERPRGLRETAKLSATGNFCCLQGVRSAWSPSFSGEPVMPANDDSILASYLPDIDLAPAHPEPCVPVMPANDDSILASYLPDIDLAPAHPEPCVVLEEPSLNEKSKDRTWLQVGSVRLLVSDKQLIASSQGLLNDKIIHAAMLLLKIRYPHQAGLEDPILCFAGHVAVAPCNMSFIQVFNDPEKTHWITVTNKHLQAGDVDVNCSSHLDPSPQCANAISRFARVSEPTMNLRVINVARQSDAYSCGLYALAYSVALVAGKDPCNLVFQQDAMRQHLIACLEKGTMTEFPLQWCKTVRTRVLCVKRHGVLCVCRSVYQGKEEMVECQFCRGWFHPPCVGLDDASFRKHQQDKKKEYKCPSCS